MQSPQVIRSVSRHCQCSLSSTRPSRWTAAVAESCSRAPDSSRPRSFSTTSSKAAKNPKAGKSGKAPGKGSGKGSSTWENVGPKKGVRTLNVKNVRKQSQKNQPARRTVQGETRELRRRVVLSNKNALEVPHLQDLGPENMADGSLHGQMTGLSQTIVTKLRTLEAFKATQNWKLFRRPATLMRSESLEMARLIDELDSARDSGDGTVHRRIIVGERWAGKTVLLLQTMAMSMLKGWVVVNIPEVWEVAVGHTEYAPVPHTSPPQFLQPQYVSKLLARIASVNEDILSRFSLTPDSTYPLPIPVSLQSNMTLGRLAQTGANDAKASWPIFLALWTELMKPGRPPILLAFDGIQHAMLPTRYVNPDMKRIHALDFSIMAHLVPYLAGLDNDVVASGGIQTQGALPRPANGMLVVAAMSESNRPSTPSLSLAIAQAEMRTHRSRDQLQHRQQQPKQLVAPDSEVDEAASVSSDTSAEPDGGQQFLVDTVGTGSVLADFPSTSRIPEPDPYFKHDDRVLKLMAHVPVVRLRGLSREEARGMLNYHAASGVLRGRVDDRLVGNAWTLSGGGVVGQLEVFTRMKVS